MFGKVLVANRGEIAVRVLQACAERGIRTVAVYSEADAGALHVSLADQAVCIGPSPAAESYLNIGAIIAAAMQTGAEAVHPGYGFLSENAAFAEACAAAGLVFIGPSPAAMRAMGSKIAAKRLAAEVGVPLLPGYDGAQQDDATLQAEANRIGYPLLIKASAGGGGRGMRVVDAADSFAEALAGARREARAGFGDDDVLLERYVERSRHVEIQVFGDQHGNVVHLGERECSIQRRHQKVIEEAPSPALTSALREAMGEAAVRLARAIDYSGAGTVEFLLDDNGRPGEREDTNFAFLEMNTRLQVEHGVTELVTGLDLVGLQLAIAAGEPLPLRQEDVRLRGWAIQCRIYAEDPARGFLPSTGTLTAFAPPQGAGIRNDVGVRAGDSVSPFYDAMLAKLLVAGRTRAEAVDRAAWALSRYEVRGPTTNLPLLRRTVEHEQFRAGNLFTGFLDAYVLDALTEPSPPPAEAVAAAALAALGTAAADPWRGAGGWRLAGAGQTVRLTAEAAEHPVRLRRLAQDRWRAEAEGSPSRDLLRAGDAVRDASAREAPPLHIAARLDRIEVASADGSWSFTHRPPDPSSTRAPAAVAGSAAITAPLAGIVVKVAVAEGEAVAAGQPAVVLEAMKMEHTLAAPADAVVRRVHHRAGDLVQAGAVLVEFGD